MERRFMGAVLSVLMIFAGTLIQAQTQRTSRSTNSTVRTIILRIENRTALFRNSVEAWAARNPNQVSGEDINVLNGDFSDSVRRLHTRFDRRQATAGDVQDVLNRAARIDDYVQRSSVSVQARNYWLSLRADLNQLAASYRLSWPQSSSTTRPVGRRLNGTYRIDLTRSDNARDAAERATSSLNPGQRRRVLDALTQRLEAPEQLAIDTRGRSVTIASSRAPQITFDADGRERVETNARGRTIRSRATLTGNQLTVSNSGDADNEFSVTFDSLEDGQRLNVTRRITARELTRPIVVQSVYEKTSEIAQFNIYNPQANPSSDTFVVADGARIVGVLDDALSTRTAAVGDRFTLRVTAPAEYADATIEGHVSHLERSGRVTGRSVMTLDFDNIRLRDGRTYRFAGLLERVRTAGGETVNVDTEGAVRDDSQTRKTGERAAIGTAVGAIIGAIAGGGKGAAIGAIVGAGGGAGSVYIQGRNDLDLARGTEMVIRAGGPSNTASR